MGPGHCGGADQSRSSRSAILRHSTFPYGSDSGLHVYSAQEAIKQCKFLIRHPRFCAFELFQNLSARWSKISVEQILKGGVDANRAIKPEPNND